MVTATSFIAFMNLNIQFVLELIFFLKEEFVFYIDYGPNYFCDCGIQLYISQIFVRNIVPAITFQLAIFVCD